MSYIETARLDLREIYESDTESIYNNWCNDPEVTKFMTWDAHNDISVTEEIMSLWLKDDKDRCVIVLRETNEIIGMIDVVRIADGIPEIGYVLGRKWWGNGYMTEACEAFTEALFAKGYKRLKIEAIVENIASNKVIQKNGFSLVEVREMEFKGNTVKVNSYIKDDPANSKEIHSSLKKNEINDFKNDILKKMIKSPAILGSVAGLLAIVLVVLGFTAFKDLSFSPAFIIVGFISLAIFVFSGVLIIFMAKYVKKILATYLAYVDETGIVNIKVINRKDYFKVLLGNEENIIEFKRKEIKSVYAKNSIIMVNTIFGAVFLPNSSELRELFKTQE